MQFHHRNEDPAADRPAEGPRRRAVLRPRTMIAAAALAVTALAATGCGSSDDAPSADPAPSGETTTAAEGAGPRVVVELFRFEPQATTAAVGQEITWTNTDGIDHAVTTDDGLVDLPLAIDGEVSHRFDEAGTYEYHCSVHPSMTGSVVVG